MIIEINSLDTLFFRDGKPFTMGTETWADGIFPPMPSVIYGALRSVYFAEHIDQLKNANTNQDPTKNLKISNIYYKIGNDCYFPIALDCVKEKEDKEDKVFVLLPQNLPEKFYSNYKTSKIILPKKNIKVENVDDGVIRKLAFKRYLKDPSDNFTIQRLSDFILKEPKIGIARSSDTHTTEEGRLYRVDMRRLSNKENERVSIVVNFEDLKISYHGFLKLGGEGKGASYKIYADTIKIDFPEFEDDEKQFKVVLTTPAIFRNGWFPGWNWTDEKNLICEYRGLELKLLTASMGKTISIGGFDMKAKKPKPMYNAVPAGSVYYFELRNGSTMEEVKEVFHQTAISDVYSEQGFGICYVGKVEEHK